MKFPYFAEIIQRAQMIVTAFRASNKEMAVLWDLQIKVSQLVEMLIAEKFEFSTLLEY